MIDDNSKEFIKRHIGPSEEDQSKMLQYVGYKSLEDLMSNTVPEKILLKDKKKFIDKILHSEEKKQKKITANLLSKKFAAKEAFSKALGTGIGGVINFNEKCDIFSSKYVTDDLNRHFSNYFQNFKINIDEKFIAIGSCSTVTSLCCVFLNLPFYNPKKIEGYEMSSNDVVRTINFLEKQNDKELQKNACIGERYMLLRNGIKILKIIMKNFPIENVIVTQKGLRDALTEEIILNYEKNKS